MLKRVWTVGTSSNPATQEQIEKFSTLLKNATEEGDITDLVFGVDIAMIELTDEDMTVVKGFAEYKE